MIRLQYEPIDVETIRSAFEETSLGGVAIFLGVVRDITDGRLTSKLFYEAYEPMAIKEMEKIAREAEQRWGGRVGMVHRLGELFPGEIAVVTIAACPHREQAFEACRFLIEKLKTEVPIWKTEFSAEDKTETTVPASTAETRKSIL
ncbi:MAG TPA: molybdenum cofactor biosynthesis protein MoaE [Fimbriimonadales bacterium]|nr:molybdenum cofactor biosynthesis protein MoaE [Fimbriimonadales bacterium]